MKVLSIEHITNMQWPDAVSFYHVWQRAKPEAGYPSWEDLSINTMRKFLPRLLFVEQGRIELDEDPSIFFIRFIGSEITVKMAHDPTGQPTGEVYKAQNSTTRFARAIAEGKPYILCEEQAGFAYNENQRYDAITLPVAVDRIKVNGIISILRYLES